MTISSTWFVPMPIRTLPREVVHLIAAGEVIDSLAAIVRELSENAIDAGANRITINVSPSKWQVRVVDNGCGMTLEDLRCSALPHSTSKINSSSDLSRIGTLGFRGEALHSLATLASLEISSRVSASSSGWRLSYDNLGEPILEEPCALAVGTIVTVTDLFQGWPGRRASISQPLRSLQATIWHLALCHPQITWQIFKEEQPWFTLIAGVNAAVTLGQILPQVRAGDLQFLSQPDQNGRIDLVLGLPDRLSRSRPDWLKVAVNGRVVKQPELEQTITAALGKTLPRDRYPVAFVHLYAPADQVDWNRHPAKSEIYLNHIAHWQTQTKRAIDQVLSLETTPLDNHRARQIIKAAETAASYNPSPSTKTLKAIAQIHNMYIAAEHPSGLWLVEQHIAHERVLYEQLVDHWQIAPLEPPIILENLTTTQVEQLQRLELDIQSFGDRLWAIRSAPRPLINRPDCAAALLELSQGCDLQTAQVAVACRTAIRNGQPLTLPEMQTLLDQWQATRTPRTCPHGRPIYLTLEESSLAKFFRRHWVIGKSHGI